MPQYGHIRLIKTVINKYSHICVAVSDRCARHAGLNSSKSRRNMNSVLSCVFCILPLRPGVSYFRGMPLGF